MLLLHHHLVLLRVVLNPLLISPFRPLRNPRGLLKRETARSHLSVRRHSTVHLHLARFLAPFSSPAGFPARFVPLASPPFDMPCARIACSVPPLETRGIC